MPPDRLDHTRKFLIADIRKAFEGVTRKGGVSWSEAGVIDGYGSDAERAAARASDTESSWWDLVHDSHWDPDAGWGGFSFLDPIGFRYYLPAAMIRAINNGSSESLDLHLTLKIDQSAERQAWQRERWSLLNRDQRRCVIRFLRYMVEVSTDYDSKWWRRALDSYWSTALDK